MELRDIDVPTIDRAAGADGCEPLGVDSSPSATLRFDLGTDCRRDVLELPDPDLLSVQVLCDRWMQASRAHTAEDHVVEVKAQRLPVASPRRLAHQQQLPLV